MPRRPKTNFFELLERRCLMTSAPLVYDGFDSASYQAGDALSGATPVVAGFDGPWGGATGASLSSGSLEFPAFGATGSNRVELSASTTVARQLVTGTASPLSNYTTGGTIGTSQNGAPLYMSVLMQIDGSSPPTSTFSLYNGGISSANRVLRILASPSNTHFQAIAGPSGVPLNLGLLNTDVNLFVVRIDFAAGADTISVWQNPVAGQPETPPNAVITGYDLSLDRVGFSRFGGVGAAQFDELRFGDSWAAVTDQDSLALLPRRPLSAEGFSSQDYPSGVLPGVWSFVPAYDGEWASTGPAIVAAGSLASPGLGQNGSSRLVLEGTTVTSRELLTSNNGPLSNYTAGGAIGTSQNGAPLYMSVLMQIDGASPPTSTFSLYNGGISSVDRVLRILASPTNTHFQAIAGPSGVPLNLGLLNTDVNLFVVRIDFAAGADTISVWQNPVAGQPETAPNAVITGYDLALDRVGFSRFGGVGAAQFDELRFGDSWAAVTDQDSLDLLPGPRSIFAVQEAPPSPLTSGQFPDGFFPFIDEFGQYRYLEWDGKARTPQDLTQAAIDEAFDLAANPSPGDLDLYGGWLAGPQLAATGYFRVEKVEGKWWLVDPAGRLFFSNGITGVSDPDREGTAGVAVKTPVSGREDYFASLPEPGDPAASFLTYETATVTSGAYQGERPQTMNFFAANALTKYGADWETASRDIAHERLRSWGVNTIGAWSDEDVYLQERTAYTTVLFPANPSLVNGDSKFPDYFDPGYRANVESRLLEESGKTLNDPWNIGYFIHNELDWTRSTLTNDLEVGLQTLAALATQPAKVAFRDHLMAKYGPVAALNAQWLTSYASWENFLSQRGPLPDLSRAQADLVAFDALYAETYFATNKAAMQAVASNHLYLGARFTGSARLSATQAAVRHADVVSINRYGADVSVLPAGLDADVPLISGEFHFSANDTGLWSDGLRTAEDQADRADKYASYLTSALLDDRFVGVHWLQYWDFPSSGKLNSNNNSNLGFVSVTGAPYAEMVGAARSVGNDLYETRVGDFVFVVDDTLYVIGGVGADHIQVIKDATQIIVTRNGVTKAISPDPLHILSISGGLGDDEVQLSGLVGVTVVVRSDSPGDSVSLAGDFDESGLVDGSDYVLWKANYGLVNLAADSNGDGRVDAADYTIWRDNLGAAWTSAMVESVLVTPPEDISEPSITADPVTMHSPPIPFTSVVGAQKPPARYHRLDVRFYNQKLYSQSVLLVARDLADKEQFQQVRELRDCGTDSRSQSLLSDPSSPESSESVNSFALLEQFFGW